MKVFYLFFFFYLLIFSSCSLNSSDWLALEEANSDCDIFTERCPRAGTGFSISGGGRSSPSRILHRDETPSNTLSLSPEVEKAKIYACNQYEIMIEKIKEGVSMNVEMGRLEFGRRKHIILIPEFDSVKGCLRVLSVDDPITRDDESKEFEMICIEDDPNYLGLDEDDREFLLSYLTQDKEEISPMKWREEVEALSSKARGFFFDTFGKCDSRSSSYFGSEVITPRNTDELKGIANFEDDPKTQEDESKKCETECEEREIPCKDLCMRIEQIKKAICERTKTECERDSGQDCEDKKTECDETAEDETEVCKIGCKIDCPRVCKEFEPIGNIYKNRDRLNDLLEDFGVGSQYRRLSENAEELRTLIDEIYDKEEELVDLRVQRTVCSIEREGLDPEDNKRRIAELENKLSALEGDLTRVYSEIREKDEEFLDFYVSEIINALNDRISPEERRNLMRRLLERMRRKMVRKLSICVYTEDEGCLEPPEKKALEAEIVHVGEFKDFVKRQYVDKYSTRLECENLNLPPSQNNTQQDRNRRELNQLCRDYLPEQKTLLAFTRAECDDRDREVSCGDNPIALKEEKERLDEEKVDKEIDLFTEKFENEFLPYFEEPYGLACAEPTPAQ